MKTFNKTKVIVALAIIVILLLIPLIMEKGGPHILGNVVSKVLVLGLESNDTCNIELRPDWNLVGFSCKTTNGSLDFMLQEIKDNYTSIHTYENSETIDKWSKLLIE